MPDRGMASGKGSTPRGRLTRRSVNRCDRQADGQPDGRSRGPVLSSGPHSSSSPAWPSGLARPGDRAPDCAGSPAETDRSSYSLASGGAGCVSCTFWRTPSADRYCGKRALCISSATNSDIAHILLDHDVQQLAGHTFVTCNPSKKKKKKPAGSPAACCYPGHCCSARHATVPTPTPSPPSTRSASP